MILAAADGYFFSSPASTLALVPIQPPVQWVKCVPFKEGTATGAEITNAWNYTTKPPICFRGTVLV
jgi:hypothetical protein